MAIPQGHLVAFCSDIGIPAAQGAAMLSVLQAAAFTSRMFWGWLSDRIGGLWTVLIGSVCQALAIAAFLATQDEAGLFAVAAAYGLGFSGIIPAYVMAIRELFPAREASWRVPTVLFVSMGGMAFGGWFAGALYDHFGFYAPAFMTAVIFNLANLALIGFLVMRQRWDGGLRSQPAYSASGTELGTKKRRPAAPSGAAGRRRKLTRDDASRQLRGARRNRCSQVGAA